MSLTDKRKEELRAMFERLLKSAETSPTALALLHAMVEAFEPSPLSQLHRVAYERAKKETMP